MNAVVVATASFFFVAAPHSAFSEEFPVNPIRLITTGAPGSIPDNVARPLAETLARELLKPVVIENRPSAGGLVALNLVAKARPDGYTIGLVTKSQIVYNVYLFKELPYDPSRDLRPVINLVSGVGVLAVHASYVTALDNIGIPEIVIGGGGIACISSIAFMHPIRVGLVKRILTDWRVDAKPVYAVFPNARAITPKTLALVDVFSSLVAEAAEAIPCHSRKHTASHGDCGSLPILSERYALQPKTGSR